jgi:prepilin-type N-terminal cleavage/methylation domain-containing protein
MNQRERGFTLIEVMLAVVLLTIGVMALVGSSALVTRMIGKGKESTIAVQVATARFEKLRTIAASNPTPCSAAAGFVSGSASASPYTAGVSEAWTVGPAPAAGTGRDVTVYVTYRNNRGTVTDTLTTTFLCK